MAVLSISYDRIGIELKKDKSNGFEIEFYILFPNRNVLAIPMKRTLYMEYQLKNEQQIKKYLVKIADLFEADKSLSGPNIPLFNQYLYALSYYIHFNERIDNSEKNKIIGFALTNLGAVQENTLYDKFKTGLRAQVDIFVKQKFNKYYLIIPTNIVSTSIKIQHFNVLDQKVLIRDYQWLKRKNFDIENKLLERHIRLHSSLDNFNKNNSFFVIENYETNQYRFADKAEEIFENFRAILNFVDRYQKTPILMWPRRPLSLIKEAPLLLIFNERKEYIDLKFRLDVIREKAINYNEIDIEGYLVKNYRKTSNLLLNVSDENLRNKLVLAFKLHNSALDNYDKDWLFCFYMWQIIEVLITVDESDKYDVIPGRVIAFLGTVEPYYDIIRQFMRRRNTLIHEADFGIFSESDSDTVKDLVELLMVCVLGITKVIKKYHEYKSLLATIDFYFKNHDINDQNLNIYLKEKKEIAKIFEKSILFEKKA